MCSYNQVNGTPACQNDKTLNGLLKGELEFSGNVMSDWGATKSGVESALGGLDIDMPNGGNHFGYALLPAVKNGSVPETRINDMITRVMAPYYLLGQDQGFPSLDLDRDATGNNYITNRQVGSAGMVLLKNTNNVLPIDRTMDTYLYIYGAAAGQSDEGYHSASSAQHGGALYQGGGSGYVNPTYGLDPLTSLMAKGRDNHLQIRYVTNQNDYGAINGSFHDRGFNNAKCLVFISAFSSEGSDRRDLLPGNNGSQLVQTVAANCPKTIVIVNSVSQLNLEAWIDLPNVVGVLWSGMPGAEYGPAIADVLFGDYNPGGKLVFTLAKNDSDYGTDIDPGLNSTYAEGVFLDYRHFDKFNITPRYSFGYGLSYTTFSFAKLDISKASNEKDSASSQYRQRRMRSYANFGSSRLYDPAYEIKFTLTNTGKFNGSEVPQLYLGFPAEAEEPPKILRGFERVYLAVGESKSVTLTLTQKDISYWNVVNQKWTAAPGDYTVWVSTSANNADVKLQGSFHI
jgi:beta-glucosidase